MRLNTNISAIVANNQLSKTQSNLEKSLSRLSSGYKINHSSDDPAGMAISDKMRSQLKGLSQASNNAADGVSVIQTAEGAIAEIQSMLTRMKELSVQAANDVNSDDERQAIQLEIDALNKEINRISDDTEFNTQTLINGNLSRRVYSDVRGVNQLKCSDNISAGDYGITVLEDARQAIAVAKPMTGAGLVDGKVTSDMAGKITINGYIVEVKEGDDLNTIVSNLMSAADKIGGSVFLVDNKTVDTTKFPDTAGYNPSNGIATGSSLVFMTDEYGSEQKLEISCDNADLANALGLDDAATDKKLVAEGLDVKADFTVDADGNRIGFASTAKISSNGTKITVQDLNNKTFVVDVPGNVAGTSFDDSGLVSKVSGTAVEKNIIQEVTDIGVMRVHVGANENQMLEINIPEISAYTIGTDTINVMTQNTASAAITAVDEAISRVSEIRSKLGAFQNRLDHTTSNISVSSENLTSALSRMVDTNMAEEMTQYTQLNVLAQAGTSMLSQANARPETVLQLLQK